MLGPEAFRDGLREYLKRFSYGNATWADLIDLLKGRSRDDLSAWSHAWVEEAGRPTIRVNLEIDNGRITRLTLIESDPNARRGLHWNQNLLVALGYPGHVDLVPIRMTNGRADVVGARGMLEPSYILPNGAGAGYGDFHLEGGSLEWLLAYEPTIPDALTRGSAWVTLWELMLDGEVPPEQFVQLALKALRPETDEQNKQRILGYLSEAYWKFLPEDRRQALAGNIEQELFDGLQVATTTTLKAAYFATLRSVATTTSTVEWLTAVWRQKQEVKGLTLAEGDYIALAEQLALRAVPDAKAIVSQQIAKTTNPDRRARLTFLAPALSADPAERDRFFASLKDVANRRREPWALDGLWYLNHPLRETQSLKYIRPALDMLPEIQRTGDIFFPRRWVDSTLGGHKSAAAAQTVRQFLDAAGPGYPERLRRFVLASSDDLFRVHRRAAAN
jgi:aminopeptidase N